jgi:hypothetical protein
MAIKKFNSVAGFSVGDTQVTVIDANANVTANFVTATGNIEAANFTTTGSAGNITGANVIIANTLLAGTIGNAASVLFGNGANISGQVANAAFADLALFATTANAVAGANVSGEVSFAATANSVAGANVSGQVANALVAGTVYTAAQPNITSVGTLSSLSVTGNILGGNIISNGTFQAATITSSSISIPYDTTFPFVANAITFNGNSLWRSNGNIAANTPFAIGNTAGTWSMVQQWTKTSRAWYVDPLNGLDTNDGSQVSPYKTIARALTVLGGSGSTLNLYPGTYAEDVTITNPNVNVVGVSLGSGVRLTGNVTLNLTASSASSQRFQGVRLNNLTIAGTGGGYYFDTCIIDAITHNGTGYVQLTDTDAENGLVTVTAAGTIGVYQGKIRSLTLANASALAILHDVTINAANVIVTSGTTLFNNCIVVAPTATANVITASAGTAVYVNYTGMTTSTGAAARVSLGGFYSFTGTVVDTANSVLGTNLNTIQVTDSLNVLNLANVATLSSRGNITAVGNITTTTGNVSGGNLVTTGRVVATGNVSGNFILGNGSSLSSLTGANVTGAVAFATTANSVSGANVVGQVANAALADLATFATTANAVAGANVSGTVANANYAAFAGDVVNSAQANITSVGTLTSLVVSGNLEAQANVITNNILGNASGVTITATGTNQNITLVPTGTGTIAASSAKITGLGAPVNSTDAATKQYVDDIAQGLNVHEASQAATTTDLPATYTPGTGPGVGAQLILDTVTTDIDGWALNLLDRILVKNQTAPEQNGIYVVTQIATQTIFTRAADYDTPAKMGGGDFTFVQNGTVNNDTGWVQVDAVVTVGVTPVLFTQFSGAGTYSAGTGLTLTGTH